MATRVERDPLGELHVPAEAYYGVQTQRAVENFPISGLKAPAPLVTATVLIKQACARANGALGRLDPAIAAAIGQAADEILAGRLRDQFVVDVYQAGAGTSHNMNTNEVLANRAGEILGEAKGTYQRVHPNDHVNMGQSTNDVFPAATRLSILLVLPDLLASAAALAGALEPAGCRPDYPRTVIQRICRERPPRGRRAGARRGGPARAQSRRDGGRHRPQCR